MAREATAVVHPRFQAVGAAMAAVGLLSQAAEATVMAAVSRISRDVRSLAVADTATAMPVTKATPSQAAEAMVTAAVSRISKDVRSRVVVDTATVAASLGSRARH